MSPVLLSMALWASAPALSVTVEGKTTCPSPAEVTLQLEPLLPRLEPWDTIQHAQLRDDGVVVRLTLVDDTGARLGERRLPTSASCATLAKAVALVIASWKSDVHADFAADLPPVPEPVAPGRAGARARAGAPDLECLIGAGMGAAGPGSGADDARSVGALAPLFLLRTIFTPPGRSLGGALFASFETDRTLNLSPGQVRWGRWAAGAGVDLRAVGRWARLAMRADVALARVALAGVGFTDDFTRTGWTPGGITAVRLVLPAGPPGLGLSAWWELGAGFWWRAEEARVEPAGITARLPRLTLMTTLGVALGHLR